MLASDMDSSGEARQGKGSWTAAVVSNLANSATWRGAPKLQHCSPCGSQTCSLERKQRGEPELQVQKLNIQDSSVGEGLSGIFPRSSEGIVDSADPTAEPLHLSLCPEFMVQQVHDEDRRTSFIDLPSPATRTPVASCFSLFSGSELLGLLCTPPNMSGLMNGPSEVSRPTACLPLFKCYSGQDIPRMCSCSFCFIRAAPCAIPH